MMVLSPLVIQAGEIEQRLTIKDNVDIPGKLVFSTAKAFGVKLRKKGKKTFLDGQIIYQGLYLEDSGKPTGFKHQGSFKCQLDDAGAELTIEDVFIRNELPRETKTSGKSYQLEVPLMITAYPREKCEQNPALFSMSHVVFHDPVLCTLDEVVGSNTIHILVDNIFSIPSELPPAQSVAQVTAQVKNITCQVVPNQVNVSGVVEENILLNAADPSGNFRIFSLVRDAGFTASIPVPGVQPGMLVTVTPSVLKATGALVDPRNVKTSIELALTARVKAARRVEVATDITCPTAGITEVIIPSGSGPVGGVTEVVCPSPANVAGVSQFPLNIAGETCCQPIPSTVAGISCFPSPVLGAQQTRVESIVFQGQVQTLVKGTLSIPIQKPEAERVLQVSGTPVITELRCIPNKLIIQGVLPVRVVYVALIPSQPVHAFDGRLRFTTFIDIPGLHAGTRVQVQPVLEFIKATVGDNPRNVDILAIVQLLVRAFEPRSGFLVV